MFFYRIFRTGDETLLAVCDDDLAGKMFEEGEMVLSVDQSFYGTETCDDKDAVRMARGSTIINAVGNRIVGLLVANKLVDKQFVMTVDGVMHAQVVSV